MLRFLYTTVPGRCLLKVLTNRRLSQAVGKFMDSRASKCLIAPFIRKNKIDLREYKEREFSTFNAFFTREIRPECRPISKRGLMAPCDGLLSAYKIDASCRLPIKGSVYSVETLLGGDERAKHFENGTALVFRLCVHHYHRYRFFDDCVPQASKFIPGVLHTVRPIALENTDVFHQNCREVTFMETKHFGLAVQIEVGAMLVGKICNLHIRRPVHRGQKKGWFCYGGSTIVLLLEEGAAKIPEALFEMTKNNLEKEVRLGERLDG